MKLGCGIFLDLLKRDPSFYLTHFDHLEIQDFALPDNLDFYADGIVRQYQGLLKDFQGTLSLHGPFKELFPSSMDRQVQQLAHRRFAQALQLGQEIGCRIMVVHSCYSPLLKYPEYADNWLENASRFWEGFLPLCLREKFMVVLENVWDPGPETICRLLESFDDPHFRACLDTGHAHFSSGLTLETWIRLLGDRLAHLHIHDNCGKDDEHLPPGRGKIDFSGLRLLQDNPEIALVSEAYGFIEEAKAFLDFMK
jgi:sugar phosphate isomerase/epimerase